MSTASTIDRLTALIEHPKTSEAERDAARRALVRLQRVAAPADARRVRYPRWEGARYREVRSLPLAEIAKLMRQDIKLARKVGNAATGDSDKTPALFAPIAGAPTEIKYSVRTEHFSGGGSIDIVIRNIPAEWGWTIKSDDFGQEHKVATPAMRALFEAIRDIHRAYNYDDSDSQLDHFNTNYYGHVETDPRIDTRRNVHWH
ncbi:hypothetical protein [Sciscionella sediminilitoris]|uniref:hypothetical protein n=1 Tax=Sciscionella sediminilitoris TaxID=1445613 RepID=UPI00068D6E56|nr:hypothetical protein [Sciscionella sp. SE31]